MAVIQDLPPELLHRIFELIEPALNFYGSPISPKAPLRTASLVARAWTAQAQRLMLEDIEIDSKNAVALLRHILNIKSRPSLKRLALRSFQPECVEALALFCELVEEVDSFSFRDVRRELTVDALYPKLLVDLKLKRLEVSSDLEGVLPSPLPGPLPLEQLVLHTIHLPPSPILRPLLLAADHLTSLTLNCMYMAADRSSLSEEEDLWLNLGPRLRHLSLVDSAEAPYCEDEDDGFLPTFLRACTALRSFQINVMYTSYVYTRLRFLSSTVQLLTTELAHEEERMPKRWVEQAFELPTLSKLKRWRMYILPRAEKAREREEVLRVWSQMCQERGIEARDERRFFTDYPAE